MYARVERFASNLAAALLFGLMFMTFIDVVGRNLFNRPLTGASELTEILLAAVIFLMLPHVALRGQHIVIDLIENVAKPGLLIALDVFAAVLSAAMFFLIGWQTWVLASKAIAYGDSTPTLHIPIGPVLYVMAVMAVIVGFAFLITIPKALRGEVQEHHREDAVVV